MLESQIEPTTVTIDRVSYSRHKKQGVPDSVRITYWSGLSIYQEWLCFDHTGYARDKAIAESAKLGLKCATTDEALSQCENWKKPIEITVKPDGKFTKIVSKRYE
jgi:DNA repair protein RadD